LPGFIHDALVIRGSLLATEAFHLCRKALHQIHHHILQGFALLAFVLILAKSGEELLLVLVKPLR